MREKIVQIAESAYFVPSLPELTVVKFSPVLSSPMVVIAREEDEEEPEEDDEESADQKSQDSIEIMGCCS